MRNFYIDFSKGESLKQDALESIKAIINSGLDYLGEKRDLELNISFVNDEEIKALNNQYRNVDQVTDVLSFPLFEEFPGAPYQLGDIVINLDQLRRQAENYGHGFDRELMYLTTHSLLHLYGYDHIDPSDKVKMRTLEEEIISDYLNKE